MKRSVVLVAAVVSVGTALSGCSGDDEHALGEAIEIDVYASAGSESVGTGTVTVTDVRDGSTSELQGHGFSLDPDEKAATAYYVDVSIGNDSDQTVVARSPGGEDPDGGLIHPLTIIDFGGEPFEPCPGVPDELGPGEEADGCAIVLVPAGNELERIYFHPGGSEDFIYWATD